ncbi:MAG: kelch repeat-containing protein, partial [Methylorubrum extorquens]
MSTTPWRPNRAGGSTFGGYVNGWEATDKVWAYDPKANAWEARAPMPTPRAAGGAAPLGDKIHVVGGSGSGRGNVRSH